MTEREVPMAPVQREMWDSERTSLSARENVYGAIKLRGRLDLPAFRRALAAVVARHEPLRTTTAVTTEPVQLVSDAASAVVDVTEVAGEDEAVSRCRAIAATRIPLDARPLWRLSLMRLPDGDHVLGFVFHHLVVDGWSLFVFLADLGEAYGRAVGGGDPTLAPLAYTYGDHCRDEQRRLSSPEFGAVLAHWRTLLPATLPEPRLPRDRPGAGAGRDRGGALATRLDPAETAQLGRRARESRCTMFTLMLDAVAMTLRELAATDDVIIGVPFHNRTKRQLRPLIGYVVTDVPMVLTDLGRRGTERARLDHAKAVTAAALRHPRTRQLLMRELYGVSDVEPYTFMLNIQDPPRIDYGLAGIDMTEELPVHNGTFLHGYELTLQKSGDGIGGRLLYDADRYSPAHAEALWTGVRSRLLGQSK